MQELNKTVWANVTVETVKSTDIWKQYADESGHIPHDKFSNVLNAALYSLGYDIDKGYGYKVIKNVYIRSQRCGSFSNQILTKAVLYSFPVRKNYRFKNKIEKIDIISIGEDISNAENYIPHADFGLEHYTTIEKLNKSNI